MRIGVLALQGDFIEHQIMLERLGVEVTQVRQPAHLSGLAGLIIPGGESTTIGKLAVDFGLIEPLRAFAQEHALWGTCAGAIFMANQTDREQPILGLMDITVERNAFGRQVDSFEIDLDISFMSTAETNHRPFHAFFIRAPLIKQVRGEARALWTLSDERIVAAQQGRWLATAFHPELTGDNRFHEYFLELTR
jgi:5'-phosphate synthase pdxT subunit